MPRARRSAISGRSRRVAPRSTLLLAQSGDLDRRNPRLVGPSHALARDLRVDEVLLAFDRVGARAGARVPQLTRVLDRLAVHAEAPDDRRHVHVRADQVVVDELAGL